MQRKSTRPAASPGIRNSIYDEVEASCCVPENQAIIKALVSITGHDRLHSCNVLCVTVKHCMKEWL